MTNLRLTFYYASHNYIFQAIVRVLCDEQVEQVDGIIILGETVIIFQIMSVMTTRPTVWVRQVTKRASNFPP